VLQQRNGSGLEIDTAKKSLLMVVGKELISYNLTVRPVWIV